MPPARVPFSCPGRGLTEQSAYSDRLSIDDSALVLSAKGSPASRLALGR